jgi:hypothetical protein
MKRKEFIKKSSAALAAVAGCAIIPSYVLGKSFGHVAPSDKVNVACCGIGNRGGDVLNNLYKTGLANIVAICDVDMGAPHTLENMQKFPNARRFQDFREMFDKMGNEFDAISVGIPDFSHFPVAMLAMSQGKHVYVEKPMAHSFNEISLMMKAEKKTQGGLSDGKSRAFGRKLFSIQGMDRSGHHKRCYQNHRLHEQWSPLAWHESFGLPSLPAHPCHFGLG